MEVRDVFALRRAGRIEEAYDAIRPMYAAHKGKYTTLAMFQVGGDMMRLRLQQGRVDEAFNIFRALRRLHASMNDPDLRCRQRLTHLAITLAKHKDDFSLITFLMAYPLQQLPGEAWQTKTVDDHQVLGAALAAVSAVYARLKNKPNLDEALLVIQHILPAALARSQTYAPTRHLHALCYELAGQEGKAQQIINSANLKPSWE